MIKHFISLLLFLFIFPHTAKTSCDRTFMSLSEVKDMGIDKIVDSSRLKLRAGDVDKEDYQNSYTKYTIESLSVKINQFYDEGTQHKISLKINSDNQITGRDGFWLGQGIREGEDYEYKNGAIDVIGTRTDSGINPESKSDVIRRFILENDRVRELQDIENQLGPQPGFKYLIGSGGCPWEASKREFYLYDEEWNWIGCFDIEDEGMLDKLEEYSFKEFTKKFVWNEDYEEAFNKRIRHENNCNDEKEGQYYINDQPAYKFFKDKVDPVPDYVVITIFPDYSFTIKVR